MGDLNATKVLPNCLDVSSEINTKDLKLLISSIVDEDCDHSWTNLGHIETLGELQSYENRIRRSFIFFYYFDGEIIGTASVSDSVSYECNLVGFPVLSRCYILKKYRGLGFYREMCLHRLIFCIQRYEVNLHGIHIGTSSSLVRRVLTDNFDYLKTSNIYIRTDSDSNLKPIDKNAIMNLYKIKGVTKKLGDQSLQIAGEDRTVGAYVYLLNTFYRSLNSEVLGLPESRYKHELSDYLSNKVPMESNSIGAILSYIKKGSSSSVNLTDYKNLSMLDSLCKSIPINCVTA